MGSQYRSHYIFNSLATKGPTDRIGEIVKNVILRKVKSGQLVLYPPREFSEALTGFVASIHSVYLPENKNIVKPEHISMTEKSITRSKFISWKENVVKIAIFRSIFPKLQMMKILFT